MSTLTLIPWCFQIQTYCKNRSWKKLNIGQLCIWKLYTYNTVYCTQGNIYSRFIFTQFSLENIGICKQKMVWFKVILRIWRKQSHTLWNKLVTYQKIDLPIFFHALKNYLKYSMNNEGMLDNFGSIKLHLVRYEV